jgi:hypothetical protein
MQYHAISDSGFVRYWIQYRLYIGLTRKPVKSITLLSQNSPIYIVTKLWAGWQKNQGSIPRRDRGVFISPQSPDFFWGPNKPSIQLVSALLPGVKQARLAEDSLPLLSSDAKNASTYSKVQIGKHLSYSLPVQYPFKEIFITIVLYASRNKDWNWTGHISFWFMLLLFIGQKHNHHKKKERSISGHLWGLM